MIYGTLYFIRRESVLFHPPSAPPNMIEVALKLRKRPKLAPVQLPGAIQSHAPEHGKSPCRLFLPDVDHFGLMCHNGCVFPDGIDSRDNELDYVVSRGF